MKNILLISIVLLLVCSCTEPTLENSVDNLTVMKSNELLSLEKNTVTVVTDNNVDFYIVEGEEVMQQLVLVNKHRVSTLLIGDLLFVLLLSVLLGFFIGILVFE